MAFIIPDHANSDNVIFFSRRDFSCDPGLKKQIVERGDLCTLRYYIIKHMDTRVNHRRPGTPLKLIIEKNVPEYIQTY
jgi:hypothetical protein